MPRPFITPNSNLGYDDFASLFLSNPNMTPSQVGSDFMYHAPQGRDFLMKQWDSLGIAGSPEDHFSRPDIQAAYAPSMRRPGVPPSARAASSVVGSVGQAAGSSVVGSVGQAAGSSINPFAPSWPTFETEAHKNIALLNGSFDPAYPSPIARTNALALAELRKKDMDERSAYDTSMADRVGTIKPQMDYSQFFSESATPNAKPVVTNSQQILQTQMAGDSRGDIGRVLRSRAGQNVNTVGAFSPYVPKEKAGNILDVMGQDTLDRELFDDPEFQRVYKTDPHRANFVYQRLTGRQLFGAPDKEGNVTTGDYPRSLAYRDSRAKTAQAELDFIQHQGAANALDLQKDQLKKQYDLQNLPADTGRDYVKRNLDAQYDQNTGKWMVYNRAPAPEGGAGYGPQAGVSSQLVQANDAQSFLLNRHWQEVTGSPIPQKMLYNTKQARSMAADREAPGLKDIIAAKEKQYGHSITFKDIQRIKGEYNQKQLKQKSGDWLSYMQASGAAAVGLKGHNEYKMPLDAMNPGPITEDNLNWWGQFLYNGGMDKLAPRTPDGLGEAGLY